MEFSIGGDTPVLDPSSDDLEAGLSALTGEGDSFAILAESPMTYIQTSGSPTTGFVLEYQIDSLDQHFRSTSHQLPLHQVIEAFERYRTGDPAWREVTAWEREDLSAGTSLPLGAVVFAVLALGAAAVWWLRAA